MIDPYNITNYHRTDLELEEFWLFCILVAGKNADTTANIAERLMQLFPGRNLLGTLTGTSAGELLAILRTARTGQYTRIAKALSQSVGLNLRTCTLDDLLAVHGVGDKTARFFLLHTRPDTRHVVIDTHMLKYLRKKRFKNVPDDIPSGKRYRELELRALKAIERDYPGMSLADADLTIWKAMRK